MCPVDLEVSEKSCIYRSMVRTMYRTFSLILVIFCRYQYVGLFHWKCVLLTSRLLLRFLCVWLNNQSRIIQNWWISLNKITENWKWGYETPCNCLYIEAFVAHLDCRLKVSFCTIGLTPTDVSKYLNRAPFLGFTFSQFGHSLFIEFLSRQSERYLSFGATDVLVCWTVLIHWTVLILHHSVTVDAVLLLLWNLLQYWLSQYFTSKRLQENNTDNKHIV